MGYYIKSTHTPTDHDYEQMADKFVAEWHLDEQSIKQIKDIIDDMMGPIDQQSDSVQDFIDWLGADSDDTL